MVASESISGAATRLIIGALPPSESANRLKPKGPGVDDSLGSRRPSLCRMAATDIDSDATFRSSFAGTAPKLAKTVIKVKNPAFSLIHSLDLGVSERIATMRDKRARV
ncbi:hypothetical protein Pst134EB_029795 [Puccinia striiformis f. sp. tritici]|nr:hypothetical protein Pst134EB_029795 [Puccinia striiformis f. sp. tritici]